MARSLPTVAFAVLLSIVLAAQGSTQLPATPIDAARLTEHVKVLASDAFEGRAPATPAERKTVDYISKQLASIGVQPGGDPDGRGGRRWTQDVALVKSDASGMKASASVAGTTIPWRQGDQIAVRSTLLPTFSHGFGVGLPSASASPSHSTTAAMRVWPRSPFAELCVPMALATTGRPPIF